MNPPCGLQRKGERVEETTTKAGDHSSARFFGQEAWQEEIEKTGHLNGYPVLYEALQSRRISPQPVSSPTKEIRQLCGACLTYARRTLPGFKYLT